MHIHAPQSTAETDEEEEHKQKTKAQTKWFVSSVEAPSHHHSQHNGTAQAATAVKIYDRKGINIS